MLRLVTVSFVSALLVAPLGFGEAVPSGFADLAKALFVVLMAISIVLSMAGAYWSRRWKV